MEADDRAVGGQLAPGGEEVGGPQDTQQGKTEVGRRGSGQLGVAAARAGQGQCSQTRSRRED